MNIKAIQVLEEVKKAVKGKDECVEEALAAILAGGHILIEDVPGVGKTTLALALSKSMALKNHRTQFTPDVLPADLIGFSMYQKGTGNFVYMPGAVMCNLYLADEINRTSPKTQSALLEVMEEGKVTVDGEEHPVPSPFIVVATQNPKGSAGTQPLPESQLDRFMVCMSMGYPSFEDEIAIAKGKSEGELLDGVRPVITAQELRHFQEEVKEVYIDDSLYKYMNQLVRATRENQYIDLGVSPRGTVALTKMVKATAYLKGRSFVIPEDVVQVFVDVARHRIVLNTKARAAHVREAQVLTKILEETQKPVARKERRGYRD